MTTTNYQLPKIEDNQPNDIKRDFNALADAVDDSLKQIENSKANTSHTHTIANVTGLQTALNDKVNQSDFTSHMEQSENSFVGEFSRATNLVSNQIINVGFKPKVVQITAYLEKAENKYYMSFGTMSVKTNNFARIFAYPDGKKETSYNGILELHNGYGSNAATCVVNNDDTITLVWNKIGVDLPTDTIKFIVSAW